MDPGQEQVAERVLGGLCSGDGDPGGKSGRKTPQDCPDGIMMDTIVNVFLSLQVHVVRPVLNRIDILIQTTVNDNRSNTRTGPGKSFIFAFFMNVWKNFFLFSLISNI